MATAELPRQRTRELRPFPEVALPGPPSAGRAWSRGLAFGAFAFALLMLDELTELLMQYWFMESIGFEQIFWTNFKAGALLGVLAFGLVGAAVAIPAVRAGLEGVARRRAFQVAALAGVVAAWWESQKFLPYLQFLNAKSFGEKDPIYGHDIGFYVFKLPAIEQTAYELTKLAVVALVASTVIAWITRVRGRRPAHMSRGAAFLGHLATPWTLASLVVLGIMLAVDDWLRIYGLLNADRYDQSIPEGAQFLDVNGIWSNKNAYIVQAIVLLLALVPLARLLGKFHAAVRGEGKAGDGRRLNLRAVVRVLAPGLVVAALFQGMVGLRNQVQVEPNQPVVQLPYIKYHIDATNKAWGLDKVETRTFEPKSGSAPLPTLDALLKNPTIQNPPLWPGYAAWIEPVIDPEYGPRIVQTAREFDKGWEEPIYGPTLATYSQQQKLRPYYDFLDVDTTRYYVNGIERMFASAVRELPLNEPKPWLAWWGQLNVLFTHGYGLVMSMVQDATAEGEPVYDSANIPPEVKQPEIDVRNPAVYYGEGAGSMAFSDVANVPEHDYPTDQGRAQTRFPANLDAGIEVDSGLKRAVLGYKARSFMDFFFSDLIKPGKTRAHLFRTPLERMERIAPFLFFDRDPYAVTGGERINWMVNGMSVTDRYPYSMTGDLGDKSARQSPLAAWAPGRWVNYARDSVKVTIDAYTGAVSLYKWQADPVLDMWQDVYPDLLKPKEQMPPRLKEQVQYPPQLLHTQMDDHYIYTHQKDPLTYFSQEDVYDDADEVVGPVLGEGRQITFSKEPYYWIAKPGDSQMPPSSEETQFTQSMIFTPENALNLRAIVNVYQDGDDYGKISVLEIPKGKFFPGPEQADSVIDQDPFISQQAALWTRRGLELIRGHTTPLLVNGEIIYVEPFFIRSKQNPLPRLKRVIVVLRGEAYMGETFEAALRASIEKFPKFPIRGGPELGNEPPFDRSGRQGGRAEDAPAPTP